VSAPHGTNRSPEQLDVVAYDFTFVAADRQAAVASARRTLAYFGRLSHYRSLFIQEGFGEETEVLKDAWARDDVSPRNERSKRRDGLYT
jgi:hypothetical protein